MRSATPTVAEPFHASAQSHWSRTWSVVVPLLITLAVIGIGYVGGELKYLMLDSQVSVEESLGGAFGFASVAMVFVALRQPSVKNDRLLKIWLILYIVCMTYYVGEDLNWGQHYFGWTAPDYFMKYNREHETNLHNMSPLLFNRVPRELMHAWLVVACILVPLGWTLPKRVTKGFVPEVLWPDRRIAFGATLALLWKVVPVLWRAPFETADAIRYSEAEELMFAYCTLLYGHMLLSRLRQPASA